MHVGHDYPYHWYYWSTECFFWPGYVPWQMMCANSFSQPYPWDRVSIFSAEPSGQGLLVPDCTQITWRWYATGSYLYNILRVSVEQEKIGGRNYAVWKATIGNIFVDAASVWYFQPAPKYLCAIPVDYWWTLHDPDSAKNGPALGFSPALGGEVTTQPQP